MCCAGKDAALPRRAPCLAGQDSRRVDVRYACGLSPCVAPHGRVHSADGVDHSRSSSRREEALKIPSAGGQVRKWEGANKGKILTRALSHFLSCCALARDARNISSAA